MFIPLLLTELWLTITVNKKQTLLFVLKVRQSDLKSAFYAQVYEGSAGLRPVGALTLAYHKDTGDCALQGN